MVLGRFITGQKLYSRPVGSQRLDQNMSLFLSFYLALFKFRTAISLLHMKIFFNLPYFSICDSYV